MPEATAAARDDRPRETSRSAPAAPATRPTRRNMAAVRRAYLPPGIQPVQASMAAMGVDPPATTRIHEPTLIGEVTLNIRSMLRNRSGLPRSEISSRGLATPPIIAAAQARRAR